MAQNDFAWLPTDGFEQPPVLGQGSAMALEGLEGAHAAGHLVWP